MKINLALLLAGFCTVAVSPAIAGTQSGAIKGIYVRTSDGLIWLDLFGVAQGRPACALSHTYWIVPNEGTDAGKRLYATLLAAQLSGREVTIEGRNTCTRWRDGEDIETLSVF